MRYTYATFRNIRRFDMTARERAEECLEQCYSAAEISQAERPQIVPVRDTSGRVVRYDLTLEG